MIAERLHIERFGLSGEELPSKATAGFTVHLVRKKIDVRVAPGETVLGALIQAGVDVLYSCEERVCGACETKLLSGAALHQDSICSPEEHDRRGTFMRCCSLSRGGISCWTSERKHASTCGLRFAGHTRRGEFTI